MLYVDVVLAYTNTIQNAPAAPFKIQNKLNKIRDVVGGNERSVGGEPAARVPQHKSKVRQHERAWAPTMANPFLSNFVTKAHSGIIPTINTFWSPRWFFRGAPCWTHIPSPTYKNQRADCTITPVEASPSAPHKSMHYEATTPSHPSPPHGHLITWGNPTTHPIPFTTSHVVFRALGVFIVAMGSRRKAAECIRAAGPATFRKPRINDPNG